MKKEDIILLNQRLIEMRKLVDELEVLFNKEDLEGVLKTKRQLIILQKRVDELL